jgi:hypothetical protein
MELKNLNKLIDKYKNYVVQQSRSNLSKRKMNDTKELYNSIKGEVVHDKKYTLVGFSMIDYGWYQDQGVKGKKGKFETRQDYKKGGFQFGTGTGKKGGLRTAIAKWVERRHIQFRDRKTGKFLTYQSTAFIIARSIYMKGLKPSLFFTKPFVEGYKKYIETDLIKAFGQDVETIVSYNLKTK